MYTNIQLSNYIFMLGLETVNTVREFTDGTSLAVYEGKTDERNDAKLRESYEKALDAVKVWLRAVLAAEVSDSRADISVEAQLLLPDRTLEVGLYPSEPPFYGSAHTPQREMLHTPIGRIDHFTYRAIIAHPENPVQVLYRFFQNLIHQIHNIAVMPLHCDGQDDLLNKCMVADEGIVDVLGIYQYDALWYAVEDFFVDKS